MRNILILTVSVLFLLSGCSEKPDRKAAKEVRKSAAEARKVISDSKIAARRIIRDGSRAALEGSNGGNIEDIALKSQADLGKAQNLIRKSFEDARLEIHNSLRKNSRNAGKLATPGIITNGNILFSQALYQGASLAILASPIDNLIDEISTKVIAIGNLSTTRSLREKLIEANNIKLEHLRKVLGSGTDQFQGLKEQLEAEEMKLVSIEKKLPELESIANEASSTANRIENSAAEKLRTAEGLSGDEKLSLQNEAYDLQMSKQEYSMRLQSANDEIGILESQVSIIVPVTTKLVSEINSVEKMIDDITSSNGNAKLLADIELNEKVSNEYAKSIQQCLGEIDSALAAYLDSLDEVTALLDGAMEQYEQVKSAAGRDMAESRLAACLLWKAGVYTESMRLQKNLVFRIKSVGTSANSSIAGKFDSIANKVLAASDEYGAKALKYYEDASSEYENVSASGEFDCAIRKTRILAYYGKLVLAEYLGNTVISDAEAKKFFDISDTAIVKAKDLIEKAKECDPMFARSITVKLIDGEIDYTPKLRVDLAGYYEEIRKDFLSWNKLRGAEKEAEVNRLLGVIEGMKPAEDPEAFDRILGAELEKLEAAIEKGFDEDEFGIDSSGADPNY